MRFGRGLRLHEGKQSVRVLDFVADIRRMAAGLRLNTEAAEFAHGTADKEAIRFPDGKVVKFYNDKALNFFQEYLQDVAEVEDLNDNAKLKFPPPISNFEEP